MSKSYEELRKEGWSPTEALEIIDKDRKKYQSTFLEYQIRTIADAIPVPDIVINNYDIIEDDIFMP